MLKILLISLFSFSVVAQAEVILSKEYAFPPTLLHLLEEDFQQASAREMKDYSAAFVIDQKNSIVLWCPPQMPDVNGRGCSLNFVVKSESLKVTMKKGLVLSFTSSSVEEALKKIDPNLTQEHQHFGSLFEAKDTFGSHYYCQPEGDEGKKRWGCYLFVSEAI